MGGAEPIFAFVVLFVAPLCASCAQARDFRPLMLFLDPWQAFVSSRNEKPETRNRLAALPLTGPKLLKTIDFALENTFSGKLAGITLPDADGHPVQLGTLWAQAPAVVVFLRHYG